MKSKGSKRGLVTNLRIALEAVENREISIIPIAGVAQNRSMREAAGDG